MLTWRRRREWNTVALAALGLFALLVACRQPDGTTPTPRPSPTLAPTAPPPAAAQVRPGPGLRNTAAAGTVAAYRPPATPAPPAPMRIQMVWAADDAFRASQYEQALPLYNRVITDTTLLGWNPGRLLDPVVWQGPVGVPDLSDPAEWERLAAYARYRLMLVYTALDNPARALRAYEVVRGTYPEGTAGAPYAALAEAFWRRYAVTQDAAFSCARARLHATTHAVELLAPLSSDFYGPGSRDYTRDDLCPLR